MIIENTNPNKDYPDQFQYVVLRIWGKTLKPDAITEMLGLEPTDCLAQGTIIGESGKEYTRPYGQWCLASRVRRNATLDTHLQDVLIQIRGKEATIGRILEQFDADIKIAIRPHADLAVWGYGFEPEIIRSFVSLGIGISFGVERW
jgi:hypothetical protein